MSLVHEKDIQRTIVEGLRAMGYEVLETSRRNRLETCPRCGESFRSHKWAGGDKGVPDLLVRHVGWRVPAGWLGLEIKGPSTKVSDEQRKFEHLGMICVVRSWEEALAAIKTYQLGLMR